MPLSIIIFLDLLLRWSKFEPSMQFFDTLLLDLVAHLLFRAMVSEKKNENVGFQIFELH